MKTQPHTITNRVYIKGQVATNIFHSAGLSQARGILAEGIPHLICPSTNHLWQSYPLEDRILAVVRGYLVECGWLSNRGRLMESRGELKKARFHARHTGDSEEKTFAFFANLFNAVLNHIQRSRKQTSIKGMIHAGSITPTSTIPSTHRPDAFLHVDTKTPLTPGKAKWRNLTCPFEYKFGGGSALDVSQPQMITCWDLFLTV